MPQELGQSSTGGRRGAKGTGVDKANRNSVNKKKNKKPNARHTTPRRPRPRPVSAGVTRLAVWQLAPSLVGGPALLHNFSVSDVLTSTLRGMAAAKRPQGREKGATHLEWTRCRRAFHCG
jgi:hypothetical protein